MTRQEILAIAKPIPFNTPMTQAVQEGRKTATRRVLKIKYRSDEGGFQVITTQKGEFIRVEMVDENECGIFPDGTERVVAQPYYVGDLLYVREAWYFESHMYDPSEGAALYRYTYRALTPNYPVNTGVGKRGWHPSIHMPKEAARLFLRVTAVRVERLRKAGSHVKNLAAEGVYVGEVCQECMAHRNPTCEDQGESEECSLLGEVRTRFARLWDTTIKPANLPLYSWDANPWVWVIEFERVMPDD